MQVPVSNILNVEPNSFQGLTKTTFQSSAANGQAVYILHQPQNVVQAGNVLNGTITPDRSGRLKFTKAPNPQYADQHAIQVAQQPVPQQLPPGNIAQASPQFPQFTAPSNAGGPSNDPRQESIEKQAYFKAAIDLYAAWETSAKDKPLTVFATDLVQVALQIKRQMRDNANGDIVLQEAEVDALTAASNVFGPGTQEVLNEGTDSL